MQVQRGAQLAALFMQRCCLYRIYASALRKPHAPVREPIGKFVACNAIETVEQDAARTRTRGIEHVAFGS